MQRYTGGARPGWKGRTLNFKNRALLPLISHSLSRLCGLFAIQWLGGNADHSGGQVGACKGLSGQRG